MAFLCGEVNGPWSDPDKIQKQHLKQGQNYDQAMDEVCLLSFGWRHWYSKQELYLYHMHIR